MKLFKFKGKQESNNEIKKGANVELEKEISGKFNIICCNLGILDYYFHLSVNDAGNIKIKKDNDEKEYNNSTKSAEIFELINSNIKYFEKLSIEQKECDNYIELNIDNNKYYISRNENSSSFYDEFIHDIANIVNIKKTYKNEELSLSFEYPNNFEKITEELDKYCLLNNSKPLAIFKDYNNNLITFEYIYINSSMVDKLINSIVSSGDYELISENNDDNAKMIIVNYKETETIQVFSFISINDMCIIFTMPIDKENNLNLRDIMNNGRINEIKSILESFNR